MDFSGCTIIRAILCPPRSKTLTLESDPFFENFNLANNFWTVSARALIFHKNISCDKTIPSVILFLTLWPWPWCFAIFFKNFNLANYFWTVSARTLIFNINIPSDKTLPWVHYFWHGDLHLGFWPIFWNF